MNLSGWNWKRIACLAGAGALGALAKVVTFTVPVLGIPGAALLGGAAAYLAGVSTQTPGHGPVAK